MDLKFVTPELRRIDLFVGEVLVLPLVLGERPPRGAAGLVDYRLAGALSRLIAAGTLSGAVGERYELSPRPRLSFDRLLLVGSGPADQFNPQVFAGVLDQITSYLEENSIRRAVVELPGRHHDSIAPELAVDILLERTIDNPLFDTWTLIESLEATRKITGRLRQDRASRWGVRR